MLAMIFLQYMHPIVHAAIPDTLALAKKTGGTQLMDQLVFHKQDIKLHNRKLELHFDGLGALSGGSHLIYWYIHRYKD